jgi:5-methylcytosine-specific restriction endonuclease McrA
MLKACSICGRIALPGRNRCQLHYIDRPRRSGTYTRDAKRIVDNAVTCHLCGQGPRPGDPFVADHVLPRVLGGPDTPDNLAPAHRSCNGRKSAKLAGI